MPSKGTLIFVWVMFLCSEAMAGLCLYYLVREKPAWRNHAVLMVISMVFVNGHGMLLFRLFPGVRTRALKYVHALFHTVAPALAIFAYTLISGKERQFSRIHLTLALTTVIAFCLEWLSAVFVFIYTYPDQARRKVFSGWHNFFGICVHQLCIATAACMIQEIHAVLHGGHTVPENTKACIANIALVMYGIFVNAIILNPYFEWRLVGPI